MNRQSKPKLNFIKLGVMIRLFVGGAPCAWNPATGLLSATSTTGTLLPDRRRANVRAKALKVEMLDVQHLIAHFSRKDAPGAARRVYFADLRWRPRRTNGSTTTWVLVGGP
jgi:hypothetical protein